MLSLKDIKELQKAHNLEETGVIDASLVKIAQSYTALNEALFGHNSCEELADIEDNMETCKKITQLHKGFIFVVELPATHG